MESGLIIIIMLWVLRGTEYWVSVQLKLPDAPVVSISKSTLSSGWCILTTGNNNFQIICLHFFFLDDWFYLLHKSVQQNLNWVLVGRLRHMDDPVLISLKSTGTIKSWLIKCWNLNFNWKWHFLPIICWQIVFNYRF